MALSSLTLKVMKKCDRKQFLPGDAFIRRQNFVLPHDQVG